MASAFPTDGAAYGVGVVVGAAVAGLILVGLAVAMRKFLCPPEDAEMRENDIDEQQRNAQLEEEMSDREDGGDAPHARLEIESVTTNDRARPEVRDFVGVTEYSESDAEAQSPSGQRFKKPKSEAIRRIVAMKQAAQQQKSRHWKY